MASARRQHYICTWSATSGEGLRKPSETSKVEFRDMFEAAVQSVSAKHYSGSLAIEKAAFVEERREPPPEDEVEHSADDLRHIHAAASFRKLTLIKRLAAELREKLAYMRASPLPTPIGGAAYGTLRSLLEKNLAAKSTKSRCSLASARKVFFAKARGRSTRRGRSRSTKKQ